MSSKHSRRFDRVEILNRLKAVEAGEMTLYERELLEQLEATREEVEQLDKHLRGVESENQELREQLEGAVRETKAYCSRCLSYVPLGWSHTCNGEVARTWEKADPTNYTERTLT